MSTNNYATENNFTVNLKKVEQIILYTQKKIYNASKKCDTDRVHKVQINLFNNLDYHILFIQIVIKQITRNILLTNHYYWKIFLYSYICINIKKTPYVVIEFIKDKVDQYKIFVLLQPEWKPRFEHLLCLTKKEIYSNKLKIKVKYFFADFAKISKKLYKTYINIDTNIKVINNQYLVNKINSIKFISSKLKLWLNSRDLIDYNYKKSLEQSAYYDCNKSKLYELLETILYIGIEWLIYINLKIKNVYKNIILIGRNKILFIKHLKFSELNLCITLFAEKIDIDIGDIRYKSEKIFDPTIDFADFNILIKTNNNFNIEPNNDAIKLLFNEMRSVLYNKNQIGQWRPKTHLTSESAKLEMQKTLLNWYKYYYHILDNIQVSKIHLIAEKLFYIWQIKK